MNATQPTNILSSPRMEERALFVDPKNIDELNKKLRQGWRVKAMESNRTIITSAPATKEEGEMPDVWEGSVLVVVEREVKTKTSSNNES